MLFISSLIMAILMSVRWCLMDLICISLTFKDIDHLLMCLFPICVSYLGKVYSGFLPIFSQVICFVVVIVAVFYFWCWVLWILLIFLILTLCLMYYLQKSIQIIGKLCLFVCLFVFSFVDDLLTSSKAFD